MSQVTAAETTTSSSKASTPTSGLPSWAPFVLGAIVIIGLVGAAIGINRRRQSDQDG